MSLRHSFQRFILERRSKNEEGLAFTEFALILPILMLLAMGIVEYGMAWTKTNEVNAVARDAARIGASEVTFYRSDFEILRQVANAFGQVDYDDDGNPTVTVDTGLKKVIVYKTSGPDGKVPSDCKNVTITDTSFPPWGVNSGSVKCNIYNWRAVEEMRRQVDDNPADVDPDWGFRLQQGPGACSGSQWDKFWCPTSRQHDMSGGNFDYLGVYIEYELPSLTGFGFGDQTISRSAVYRIEPTIE